MVSLLKIRSMLEQMSVIERRLADFILDNSHLLRDYSSQQLADAVGISQSSVVKFCQKLGYKGYPDLRLAVNEAVITATTLSRDNSDSPIEQSALSNLAEQLQFSLSHHFRGLLEINTEKNLLEAIKQIKQADNILLAGYGKSAIVAADIHYRLLQSGKAVHQYTDPAMLQHAINQLSGNSLLFVISESGQNSELLKLAKLAKSRQIKLITLTSYRNNALSLTADLALFVLSGEEDTRINPLLVQMAQQHLCHILYLLLSKS